MFHRLSVYIIILMLSLTAWGFQLKPTIVGGQETRDGEVPFIVSIQSSQGHYCGGSLIKSDWILTAGHCVYGESPSSIAEIHVGLHSLSNPNQSEVFRAKKIVVHPKFSGSSSYDFALVQLDRPSKIRPVELNTKEIQIDEINPILATVAGWGNMSQYNDDVVDKLAKVMVPLVSQSTCNRSYHGRVKDEMICAGYANGGKDACQGDSGGPLFLKKSSGEHLLIGVVSWGEGCAQPQKYGVYSKVNAVHDWILSAAQSR